MPVQVRQGLVQQQHVRAERQGAGQRHPLLLAAGELGGLVVEPAGKAHGAEQLRRPRLGDLGALARDTLRQGDVVERRELRQEVVELVDEADGVQAQPRACALRELVRRLAGDRDLPLGGSLQQPGGVQQAGLARARGPDEADDLAGENVEVHPRQHL